MFLLAAPPCMATWGGVWGWQQGVRIGTAASREGQWCRQAACCGLQPSLHLPAGAPASPHQASLAPPTAAQRAPQPDLGVHNLRDAVHKLHHILLQHLGGVCNQGVIGEGGRGQEGGGDAGRSGCANAPAVAAAPAPAPAAAAYPRPQPARQVQGEASRHAGGSGISPFTASTHPPMRLGATHP